MLLDIPKELRDLPQWICTTNDKIPRDPKTGGYASVTDLNTWGTFTQAMDAGMPYIGFVFTEFDPYCGIDLDTPKNEEQFLRHNKILATIDSYTERSVSGNGFHIIVKGSIPSGVRRDQIEIYSNKRYFIFTGNVARISPIRDYNEIVNQMWIEMGGDVDQEPQLEYAQFQEDIDVYNMARNAANGDKFMMLWEGKWKDIYPSQSEADFALMAMLTFYSPNNQQCIRLFKQSRLMRPKADRPDYLPKMIQTIRNTCQPKAEIAFDDSYMTPINGITMYSPPEKIDDFLYYEINTPPGLIQSIERYIYESSIRPAKEIAFCAAITLFAGIVGRQYNVSGTGLNQYTIFLAPTGTGKEGAASGIERIISALSVQFPMINDFVGHASYASGQALVRMLSEKPCVYSILGEFGITLRNMCGANAAPHLATLKQVLLDVYQKSGWHNVLRSSAYSDKDKNTSVVQSPCLTILGESTPEVFYDALDETLITDGLIPRFLIVEYSADRPRKNPNAFFPPPPPLIDQMAEVLTAVMQMQVQQQCCVVNIDPEARKVLDTFDEECDERIRGANEIARHLWNRAHLMVIKLAALFAVSRNIHHPEINLEEAEFAIGMVRHQVEALYLRFKKHLAGSGDMRLQADIVDCCKQYFQLPPEKRKTYGINEKLCEMQVIPVTYLKRVLLRRAKFKDHPRGGEWILEQQLKYLVANDGLKQIPPVQVLEQFNMRAAVYIPGEMFDK